MKKILPCILIGMLFAAPSLVLAVPDPDPDSDGIPTAWEEAKGLLPGVSNVGIDSDSDGVNDVDEYIADTHPKDDEDFLKMESFEYSVSTTSIVVRVDTSTNRLYWLMYTPVMSPPDQWDEFVPFLSQPVQGLGEDDTLILSGEFPLLTDLPLRGFISIRVRVP